MMLMENSILLLVISILFKIFKPKKRNAWYGYRTRLSKLSQSNWDEAQKYSSTIFIIVSSVLFVLGILFKVIAFKYELVVTNILILGGLTSGLMSIFWTQKVKLFYAALLANNSH